MPTDDDPPVGPLVIVTGKGGVGRSTTAAAIACNAADQGLKVLAVDAVGDGGLESVLAERSNSMPSGGAMLQTLCLTPDRALKEYLRIFLRIPIAANRLAPLAKIFDYVATAAPGVREILVLGKIATEVRDGAWDLVVVDGPATGHAVELLTAADTLSDLIRVGPIVSQTRWIGELLADPTITSVLAVTLAEELPISECLELLERMEDQARVAVSGIIVNRAPTLLDSEGEHEARVIDTEHSRIARERSLIASRQIARLDSVSQPLLLVPSARPGISALRQMRSALESWL